jgi:transcriptional regulator with XRE-family HTH domain
MGAPKPCLGYASRTAAVHGLRAQGLSSAQIACAIGIGISTVSALECGSSRPTRCREPRPSEQLGRTVVIPVDVLDALSPHAARRGIHVNTLARQILCSVVDDNMVDAVMDDADDQEITA